MGGAAPVGGVPVQWGPSWTNVNMSWGGGSLYSEVQVEQFWTCLGEGGSLYSEAQVDQVWTCLGEGGSLYSEVQVDQVWTCLGGGGGSCTVRSKMNKFEHVWGRGFLYSEVQDEQVWTCLGEGVPVQWGPRWTSLDMSWGGVPVQWGSSWKSLNKYGEVPGPGHCTEIGGGWVPVQVTGMVPWPCRVGGQGQYRNSFVSRQTRLKTWPSPLRWQAVKICRWSSDWLTCMLRVAWC